MMIFHAHRWGSVIKKPLSSVAFYTLLEWFLWLGLAVTAPVPSKSVLNWIIGKAAWNRPTNASLSFLHMEHITKDKWSTTAWSSCHMNPHVLKMFAVLQDSTWDHLEKVHNLDTLLVLVCTDLSPLKLWLPAVLCGVQINESCMDNRLHINSVFFLVSYSWKQIQ